jgi:hypothetical protein
MSPIKTSAPALTLKALVIAFPMPQLSTLFAKGTTTRPSNRVTLEEVEFEDTFTNLALCFALFNFLTLIEEERQLIKAIIDGKLGLEEIDLEMVRLLKRIFIIPSDISMISDESYNRHLDITRQMTFNIRDFLISRFCLVF